MNGCNVPDQYFDQRDIRISSVAPKQRPPNLSPGMKAMEHRERPLEGITQAEAAGVHKFA